MERIPVLSFGSSTWRNCSKNQRTEDFAAIPDTTAKYVRLGGGLAGANFLPAAGALVGLENFLAQADGFRRDFHVLIVRDKLDGLLEAQLAVRNQADRFVRAGRAHVGLLLFLCNVYVHVLFARILADDHALVDVDCGPDEQFAALLDVPQRKCGGWSAAVRHQCAGWTKRHLSAVFHPAFENRMNQRRAARVREHLAAQDRKSVV